MTRRVTFFSRTTSGAVKTWSCWIEADGITVTSEWGIKNGKKQRTSDTMKSRGRKDTKSYKAPADVALEEHARQVKAKLRAGYVEAEERAFAVQLEKLKAELDFDRLPRAFAPAKPVREIAFDTALAWEEEKKIWIQRKRDGMRHYIVAGNDGTIRVFSRGMDDMTEHFKRLIQELTLPAGTILDAEFVITTRKGADDFTAVSEICRSKPERAARTMVHKELSGSQAHFYVFDLLYYDRLPTWQLPYSERYPSLVRALEEAHQTKAMTQFWYVRPMPLLSTSTRKLAQCIGLVQKNAWEGLVLWRKDQATQVRMNRTPARCNCYKFKPMREDDFVATGFNLGEGRNQKLVGAVNIAFYEGKKLVSLGNVGTGFDDDTRKAALRWTYPCVIQVKYEKRSGKGLRHPSFLRKREDKRPRECTLDS